MGKVDYRIYIVSREWCRLASRIKKRDKGCLVCGTKKDLNVHHGTYKHLGREFDDELFTLCNFHHFSLHESFKKKKKQKKKKGLNLFAFTKRFVDRGAKRKGQKISATKRPFVKFKPEKEEYTGNFAEIFKNLAKQFPKKEKEAYIPPAPFKSKNQLRVEERKRLRAERRAKRRTEKERREWEQRKKSRPDAV